LKIAHYIVDVWEVVTNSFFAFGDMTDNYRISSLTIQSKGTRGGAVGLGTALQAGRKRVRFPTVSLGFFIEIILPAALWPWG
jgi:hypothetical protein